MEQIINERQGGATEMVSFGEVNWLHYTSVCWNLNIPMWNMWKCYAMLERRFKSVQYCCCWDHIETAAKEKIYQSNRFLSVVRNHKFFPNHFKVLSSSGHKVVWGSRNPTSRTWRCRWSVSRRRWRRRPHRWWRGGWRRRSEASGSRCTGETAGRWPSSPWSSSPSPPTSPSHQGQLSPAPSLPSEPLSACRQQDIYFEQG